MARDQSFRQLTDEELELRPLTDEELEEFGEKRRTQRSEIPADLVEHGVNVSRWETDEADADTKTDDSD